MEEEDGYTYYDC